MESCIYIQIEFPASLSWNVFGQRALSKWTPLPEIFHICFGYCNLRGRDIQNRTLMWVNCCRNCLPYCHIETQSNAAGPFSDVHTHRHFVCRLAFFFSIEEALPWWERSYYSSPCLLPRTPWLTLECARLGKLFFFLFLLLVFFCFLDVMCYRYLLWYRLGSSASLGRPGSVCVEGVSTLDQMGALADLHPFSLSEGPLWMKRLKWALVSCLRWCCLWRSPPESAERDIKDRGRPVSLK